MSLTSFPIKTFGGLNLIEDPEEVGATGAIETKNVIFDAGVLRTRPGYSVYGTMGGAELPERIFAWPRITTSQYLASSGSRLEAFGAGAAVAAQATTVTNAFAHDFAAFGSTTVEYIYTVGRNDQSRRWDGAAFTAPAGIPDDSFCVGIQPLDNRLVCASIGGELSKVFFSDAGAPETFTVTNFVHLTPGDGESIVALCSFNDKLFAFKQTKFFVFTGNSVGPTGLPVFNYRMVDTGIGISDFWPGSAVTGPDGIYFRGKHGIYRTSGGPPVLISKAIEPVFSNPLEATSTLFGDGTVAIPVEGTGNGHTELRFISDRHLVVSMLSVSGSFGLTFVWDRLTDSWSYWNIQNGGTITAICEPLPGDTGTSMLFSNGSSSIFKVRPVDTTDNGTAIASFYQSGFYEPSPGNEVSTRWTELWGTGSPTFDIFTNHATSDPLTRGGAVTLGTSPAVAKGTHLKAYTGQLFSHKISSTSAAWSLNRIEHQVTNVFQPS